MTQWQIILEELIVRGYTEITLAPELETSIRTLKRLRKGETREPRYTLGQALISLYYKACANKVGS